MDRYSDITAARVVSRGDNSGFVHTVKGVLIWAAWRLVSLSIVIVVLLLVYEFAAPLYQKVALVSAKRHEKGVSGTLVFTKVRACAPVPGTGVAFVDFSGVHREPVEILNSKGEPISLRNFPPSETPVSVELTWVLTESMPNPSHVSYSFDVKCITPIKQLTGFRHLSTKLDN